MHRSGEIKLFYSCSDLGFCFLVGKLMEMHGESGTTTITTDETGAKIERDSFEPPVQESV